MLRYSTTLSVILHCVSTKILSFDGTPDFKTVTLNWKSDTKDPSYTIKFCENQIWGEHFCREQRVTQRPNTDNVVSTDIHGKLHFKFMLYTLTCYLDG